MDYFTLLELPRGYRLDEGTLHRAYIQKQREYHPDRMARAPQEERMQAMQMSVEVNQAYNTLKSPLLRAEYVLKLAGAEEQKPSQALLMESMEAREELMEVETPEVLAALEIRHRAALDTLYDTFASQYEEGHLEAAAESTLRMRYLHKLLEEIRARGKMLAEKKERT